MDVQPYDLWIVWDETDGATRQSHYARVLGWLDPTIRTPGGAFVPGTPLPVVIHPDTQLPVTLGHDGPAAVSRMEIASYGGGQAKRARDQRRTEHEGQRNPSGQFCNCPYDGTLRIGKGDRCTNPEHVDPLQDPRWGPNPEARAAELATARRIARGPQP